MKKEAPHSCPSSFSLQPSALKNAGGKSAAEVREMFAHVARRYDFLNHFLSLARDLYWRKEAARQASGLGAGDLIVDVCTGTGGLAFAFHRAAPEAAILALDFTPEMLALALGKAERKKVRALLYPGPPATERTEPASLDFRVPICDFRAGLTAIENRKSKIANITFSIGDALALPLPDDSAALAGVAFGLRNVADTERALKEMIRVIRPGGKVLVLEFTRPRGRLFGPLYMLYFRHVLPLLGRALAENFSHGEAYSYLPRSVEAFAGPDELARQLAALGLQDVRALPLTCGVVHLYVGLKTG